MSKQPLLARLGSAKSKGMRSVMMVTGGDSSASFGDLLQKNPNMHREALKFWKRAAKLGAREAQAAYGEILYRGEDGVPRDPEDALLWLTKAAKQGEGRGQGKDVALAQVKILLGFMYLDGDGTKEDPTEAIKWFKRASEHGNADAAKHMCYLYNTGQF